MNKQLMKDALGWGSFLWLIGYALGIGFFAFVPPALLGWAIMPFGVLATVWVLLKRIKSREFGYYLLLATTWTVLAVAFDYFFLVKLFNPADGYYKLDVYLYYVLTFALPLAAWQYKKMKRG